MKTYALVSRTPTARRDISRVNDAYYPSSATRLADHHSFLVVSFLLTWPRTVLSRARASRAIHPRVVGPIDRRRSEGTPRTHLQSRDPRARDIDARSIRRRKCDSSTGRPRPNTSFHASSSLCSTRRARACLGACASDSKVRARHIHHPTTNDERCRTSATSR